MERERDRQRERERERERDKTLGDVHRLSASSPAPGLFHLPLTSGTEKKKKEKKATGKGQVACHTRSS